MKFLREAFSTQFPTTLAVLTLVATFVVPEVRSWFGLEPEPPGQGPAVPGAPPPVVTPPPAEEKAVPPHPPSPAPKPVVPVKEAVKPPWQRGSRTLAPRNATKKTPFVNSLGMKFVPVSTGKDGATVLFCIWETRRQDYEAYAAANDGVDQAWKSVQRGGMPVGREPTHPVVGVSWKAATAFCDWLTQGERGSQWISAKDGYRLPTDAEWSYAAGIGLPEDSRAISLDKDKTSEGVYPWGKGYPPPANAGNYADFFVTPHGVMRYPQQAGQRDGYATTSPVGSFPPNSLGIFDLGGNVCEMCLDLIKSNGAPGACHVLRGASWDEFVSGELLSSKRFFISPEGQRYDTGFRCVLVVSAG